MIPYWSIFTKNPGSGFSECGSEKLVEITKRTCRSLRRTFRFHTNLSAGSTLVSRIPARKKVQICEAPYSVLLVSSKTMQVPYLHDQHSVAIGFFFNVTTDYGSAEKKKLEGTGTWYAVRAQSTKAAMRIKGILSGCDLAEWWTWSSRVRHGSGWDLAELLESLTANAKVASVLGSISAFSDTSEYKGRQMEQCWIKSIKKSQKIPPFMLIIQHWFYCFRAKLIQIQRRIKRWSLRV